MGGAGKEPEDGLRKKPQGTKRGRMRIEKKMYASEEVS